MKNRQVYPVLKVVREHLKELPLEFAHYTDIVVRVNGAERHFEGDWLKGLKALLVPPKRVCPHCQQLFQPKRYNQRHCCRLCQSRECMRRRRAA